MIIKEKLYWEKYRPKKIESIILLPRIRNLVKDGIKTNLLLYGSPGTGKSSLSKILTENTNCLKINCSIENGIDVIRENIQDHIDKYGIFSKKNVIKTVWLEEFDGTTQEFRRGLRGFIEEYSDHVRFIATCNSIQTFKKTEEQKAILSRFNVICFDPSDQEEKEFLKDYQIRYLKAICKNVKIDTEDSRIEKIVNKHFPDLRAATQSLQDLHLSNNSDAEANYTGYYLDIYNFMLDGNNDTVENFNFVMNGFKDKSDELLLILGRPFFKHLIDNKLDTIMSKGEKILNLCKCYNAEYNVTIDPEMHVFSFITEMKSILNG